MQVLIAEDDPISRKILAHFLGNEGFEVLSVSNGREAWEVIKKGDVRLVISDWVMPELDGIELCKRLREADLSKYVYIIMVTAKNRTDDLIKGLEAGADDFIFKPINKAELLVKIKVGRRILELENELFDKNQQLSRANELLTKMSLTDSLMEIGNRRSFHQYMEKVHATYSRYGTPYCIAMADIDNFKSFNDTYGHREGDKVLKLVAQSIKKTVRISDEVFRYGGEEIAIIFSNQKVEGGYRAAERVRRKIESLGIVHEDNRPFGIVTISIGVACSDLVRRERSRWEDVLKQADIAVYRAKRNGKNQVQAIRPGNYEVVQEQLTM